jgi:hypothetical protein
LNGEKLLGRAVQMRLKGRKPCVDVL